MQAPRPASRRALIVGADEWCAGALESVLAPAGYLVLRASDDAEILEIGAGGQLDLILVGSRHAEAVELCRRLRHHAVIAAGTPIILMTVAQATLEQRMTGLRAGAWDVLAFPMNAQELLARIEAFVTVKLEADRVRAEGLLDHVSGLYAVRGMEFRARELLAEAARQHLALACVVLGADPQWEPGTPGTNDAVRSARVLHHVAKVLRTHGRLSDVIGRWSEAEFAVLAPGTRATGAARLAQRLAWLVEKNTPSNTGLSPVRIRAGYEVVDDAAATHIRAQDLLTRARTAFMKARVETGLPHVRQYSPDMSVPGLAAGRPVA